MNKNKAKHAQAPVPLSYAIIRSATYVGLEKCVAAKMEGNEPEYYWLPIGPAQVVGTMWYQTLVGYASDEFLGLNDGGAE